MQPVRDKSVANTACAMTVYTYKLQKQQKTSHYNVHMQLY